MRRFSDAQLDALFAAILVNDDVDAVGELPAEVRLDYPADQLRDGFAISHELWARGFDRDGAIALIDDFARDGRDDPALAERFKHLRARFKHLRFAFVLYDRNHRCPTLFKAATTALGHLQDAVRSDARIAVARYRTVLRLLLTRAPLGLLERGIAHFRPTDTADYRAFVLRQVAALRRLLRPATLTGHQFHVARKIVSRQVSFHDDIRVLRPSAEHVELSRYMSAINGLMGRHHDVLVAQKARRELNYAQATIVLPPEIRLRLTALAELYPV